MIEIRSYRRVFDLERRIYRVDRFRLNPGGVPLRGLVYMSANVAALTVLARIPVIGWPLAALPWYLLYVALPLTTSTLLAVVQVEGRPFHLAALPLIGARHARWLRSRTRCVAAWHPPPMVVLADGSDNDMRALRYRGPGIALVAIAHQRSVVPRTILGRVSGNRVGGSELVLESPPDAARLRRGEVIAVARGARLRVRPHPSSRSRVRRWGS